MNLVLPKYVTDLIDDLLKHLNTMHQLLTISMKGIRALQFLPAMMTAFDKETDGYEAELHDVEREVSLAKSEISNGYPFLHAQMSVSLWSTLESFVRNLLVAWLKNMPDAIKSDEIKKVKVKVGEYESFEDEEDKYNYVLDLLEDHLNIRRSPGIGRFNSLLNVFGLSVILDDDRKRDIFELYHVRNVLVHRKGLADRKIVKHCPWLNLTIGQPLMIKEDSYAIYQLAVSAFVLEVLQQIRTYIGMQRADTDDEAKKSNYFSDQLRAKRDRAATEQSA